MNNPTTSRLAPCIWEQKKYIICLFISRYFTQIFPYLRHNCLKIMKCPSASPYWKTFPYLRSVWSKKGPHQDLLTPMADLTIYIKQEKTFTWLSAQHVTTRQQKYGPVPTHQASRNINKSRLLNSAAQNSSPFILSLVLPSRNGKRENICEPGRGHGKGTGIYTLPLLMSRG